MFDVFDREVNVYNLCWLVINEEYLGIGIVLGVECYGICDVMWVFFVFMCGFFRCFESFVIDV